MWQPTFFLLTGMALLIAGGELLVRGASAMALRINISPLVVGLTVVAFGTSAPELFISIQSALTGSPDLALGNVVGSNICNLALVLGVTALIYPVKVQPDSLRIDWPVAMGSALLLFLLVQDQLLGLQEGLVFIVLLFGYNFFIIRKSQQQSASRLQEQAADEIPATSQSSIGRQLLFIGIGIAGLSFGSDWFVGGARSIAMSLGMEERIIGVTVVAIGTSLPELMTAGVAAYKKETDIAVGNVLGSNIFNVLSILGFTSIIQPIEVNPQIIDIDMLWMLGISLLIFPLMLIQRRISRIEGFLLLSVYGYYVYSIIL